MLVQVTADWCDFKMYMEAPYRYGLTRCKERSSGGKFVFVANAVAFPESLRIGLASLGVGLSAAFVSQLEGPHALADDGPWRLYSPCAIFILSAHFITAPCFANCAGRFLHVRQS